jgi:hypothetical protein
MAVRRGIDIWSRLVDRRVDAVGCRVQKSARPAVYYFSFFVYEDEVGRLYEGEGDAEGIDPEG